MSLLIYSPQELDNAKRTIAELEGDLQSERGRLRTLTTEQNRIHRQKEDLLLQLRRTESVSHLRHVMAFFHGD